MANWGELLKSFGEIVGRDGIQPFQCEIDIGEYEENESKKTLDLGVLGQKLKAYRVSQGMSQKDLGKETGISQGDISNFERGKYCAKGLNFEILKKIAGKEYE